ncbi:MFS transporter [Amycolatopsis sp. NPDC005232]|uniref:MFS transporter n=1 Tax=Amycolatopsis sp. NPDC005232 TaxID=3157027 RepID=UPI0033A8B461
MVSSATTAKRPARQLLAGAVGHFVEFFDFLIYSYLAIYFAGQFFPSSSGSQLVPLLSAFGVFAAGFLVRPIAGLVIGVFADRYGRRAAMTMSVWMMGAASLLIAITPTYAQIGIGAPIVLVVARILQGLSTGGEYTAAAAFLVESAPANRRGLFSSFMFVSSSIGKMVALGVVALLAGVLGDEAMRSYGWRIPFALGAVIAVVAWWIRHRSQETLEQAETSSGKDTRAEKPGLFEAMRRHPVQTVQAVGLVAGIGGSVYLWTTYFPTYASVMTDLGASASMVASLIGLAVYTVAAPLVGLLADRVGTRPIMYAFAISTAVGTVPLLHLMSAGFVGVLAAQIIGLLFTSLGTSIMAAVLVQMFPQRFRVAGMGFPYSLSIAIFGGTVSTIGTALASAGAENWFGWYIAALSVITLITTISLPRNRRHGVSEERPAGDHAARPGPVHIEP